MSVCETIVLVKCASKPCKNMVVGTGYCSECEASVGVAVAAARGVAANHMGAPEPATCCTCDAEVPAGEFYCDACTAKLDAVTPRRERRKAARPSGA